MLLRQTRHRQRDLPMLHLVRRGPPMLHHLKVHLHPDLRISLPSHPITLSQHTNLRPRNHPMVRHLRNPQRIHPLRNPPMVHLLRKPPISLQHLNPHMGHHLQDLPIIHLLQDRHTILQLMEIRPNDRHMPPQHSHLPQRGQPTPCQCQGVVVHPVLVPKPSMVNLSRHRFSTTNNLSITVGPISNRQAVVPVVDLQPKGLLGIAPATAM